MAIVVDTHFIWSQGADACYNFVCPKSCGSSINLWLLFSICCLSKRSSLLGQKKVRINSILCTGCRVDLCLAISTLTMVSEWWSSILAASYLAIRIFPFELVPGFWLSRAWWQLYLSKALHVHCALKRAQILQNSPSNNFLLVNNACQATSIIILTFH